MSAGSLLTVFMDMLLFFVPMKFAFLGIETRHWIDHLVPGFFVWCSFSGDRAREENPDAAWSMVI